MRALGEALNVPLQVGQVGSMFGFYFLKSHGVQVRSYAEAKQHVDVARFAKFFWAMADRGVYLAPSAFEAGFVSAAHGEHEVDVTLQAAREALR
jgi:glutamate-1-semialdehyde 2,1-aminomutase